MGTRKYDSLDKKTFVLKFFSDYQLAQVHIFPLLIKVGNDSKC